MERAVTQKLLVVVAVVVAAEVAVVVEAVVDLLAVLEILQASRWARCSRIWWAPRSPSAACCCTPS